MCSACQVSYETRRRIALIDVSATVMRAVAAIIPSSDAVTPASAPKVLNTSVSSSRA